MGRLPGGGASPSWLITFSTQKSFFALIIKFAKISLQSMRGTAIPRPTNQTIYRPITPLQETKINIRIAIGLLLAISIGLPGFRAIFNHRRTAQCKNRGKNHQHNNVKHLCVISFYVRANTTAQAKIQAAPRQTPNQDSS